jgi:DNA-binding transcriptional MerR regulator
MKDEVNEIWQKCLEEPVGMKYEDIKDFWERCNKHPDHQNGMISYSMIERRLREEIEELRQYIEQREQSKQKPVAWMHTSIEDNVIAHKPADLKRHPERWTALYPAPSPCPTCEALARTVMLDQTSHDTKRTWVGLTKEEAKEISLANRPYVIDMIAALEARLKEKNGG